MGWLRDLMGTSEPKIGSYGELARRCLEHPGWPPDIQPQTRSLASLYSKFDRGIEVEWLHDRPEVQVVMATVLGLPAPNLSAEIKKHVASSDNQLARWRSRDFPQARPIDLRTEELPPVFADVLTRPGLWERLWWSDGHVQGAELLGRWLAARALAAFAVCFTSEDLLRCTGAGNGPLFVLYFGPALSQAQCGLALDEVRRPLCITGHGPAPQGFSDVEHVPVSQVQEALIRWLVALLPARDDFEVARVSSWLTDWQKEGVGVDFESASGLVGAAHQLGLTDAQNRSVSALALQYLKFRFEQLESTGLREAKWLRLNGLDLPVGIAKNALLKAVPQAWDTPRAKAEWLDLVPDEYQRGVDADWTRVSLQRAGTPLTVAELEKALSEVPPGGFRVLKVLCDAGVLQEVSDDRFSFYPRWFAHQLEEAAYTRLLEDDAESWGRVALVKEHVRPLLRALNREFAEGQVRTLEAALDLETERPPAFVAATELLVLAAGRSLLTGGELEEAQIVSLLELQDDSVVEVSTAFSVPYQEEGGPEVPQPRLLPVADDPALWGEWLIAVWSLTEKMERRSALPADLDPWDERPRVSPGTLAVVEAHLGQLAPDDRRVPAIYSLLGRVLQHLERTVSQRGPASETSTSQFLSHRLFAVPKVLRGDGWTAWQQTLDVPHGVESVRALVAPEAWPYLVKTAWRTWLEKGADETGLRLFTGTEERAQQFWPHLPDRVLQGLLDARHPVVLEVPSDCMKAEWVTMYLERVPEVREMAVSYLEVIPAGAIVEEHFEVLFELLEKHTLLERARPIYEAHPGAASARLIVLLDQGRTAAAALWLAAVPDERRGTILDHLREKLERYGTQYAAFALCRAWLLDLCSRRASAWSDVYPLLEEFERRSKRVDRAFGARETPAQADEA